MSEPQPRTIPNPLWCEACQGRGYVVGDAEWEPFAMQCLFCKTKREAAAIRARKP
jgi:hypothetical protein